MVWEEAVMHHSILDLSSGQKNKGSVNSHHNQTMTKAKQRRKKKKNKGDDACFPAGREETKQLISELQWWDLCSDTKG